jgi:integrase
MGKFGPVSARVVRSTETVQPAKRPKSDRLEETKYLEQKEIDALFRVIKTRRDKAIFRLAYHHGLRAHEIGLIQISDYRDRDGVLFIRRGKGSVSREHSLTENELRSLRAYLKADRGAAPGPMFPSRQGKRGITRTRLDQLMKEYCKLAKISPAKAHMHALKHSCGTHLAERGASAEEIQDWLGHRDSGSTQIYLHFSKRRRTEMAERHRDW